MARTLLQPEALENRQLQESLRTLTFDLDPSLAVEHPALRGALAAWEAARGGRLMPRRADIDPLQMPRAVLPHILLMEIEREPRLRFRWRLIGTHITGTLGRDSTGRYLDELYEPKALAGLLTGPRWVMEHRRPIRTIGTASFADKAFLRLECIQTPLSEDGENVSMLLMASAYER